jgi:hypothetical protein
MMNIFHGIAALAFAHLLELFAGNLQTVLPFSICVLNRITAKFSLPWVFLCGFFSGMIFDLIYWRTFPVSAVASGVTLLLVRNISDRAAVKNRFADALLKGALSGALVLFLTTAMQGSHTGAFLPRNLYLLTAVAGAAFFQLLISPGKNRNNDVPERNLPKDRESGSGKPFTRSGRRNSSSGVRSVRKKK